MRILLVEDNADHLELMILALTGQDPTWQVEGVASGEEALRYLAEEEAYDLVFLDYRLPQRNGLEVLEQIRRGENPPPVVMVTGLGDEQVAVEAMKAGADDYVVKGEGYLQRLPVLAWRAVEAHRSDVERKQAEERLRESEERLFQVVQGNSVPAFVIDSNHIITHWNKACENLTGVSANEVIGTQKQWLAFYSAERPVMADLIADNMPEEEVVRYFGGKYRKSLLIEGAYEAEGFLPNLGEKGKWLFCTTAPLKDAKGEVIGAIETLQDITERKRVIEALKESEEQISLTVENAPLGIGTIHLDGRLRSMNQAYCDMLGYSSEELLNMAFDDITHPDDKEKSHKAIGDLLEGKVSRLEFEKRYIRKDGSVIDVIQRGGVVHDTSGNPLFIIGVSEDVTEKRKLEAQLLQAQKMEAIGTLSGGIAHDFNNLLMGIQGNASLMLLSTDSDHPHYERLRSIEQCVQSGVELTRQLLGFARGGRYEVKPIDINELIQRTSTMFGRTKKEIKIYRKYQKGIFTVEVDPGQIEQVLLNLYVNAWEAMPEGGELYLQSENVTLDEDYIKPFTIKPGRYVKISVTDTGLGMDDDTKKRIFDPFFTTKEMGRGAGLGLASVYGIIKNHGGIINVYSEKAEGTTFNIYLPASEKEIKEERKVAEELLKGIETVLLVDDEDIIIDVGSEMLKSLDYEVLIAGDAKEAIRLYNENKEKIDMVILDMIMPDMGGGEAYDRLKEINPNIKVLLSSGYSINSHATDILERGCDGFIQKPFNMRQLSQKIREILDK